MDTGSTPVYSIEKLAFMLVSKDRYWLGTQLGTQTNIRIIREENCISASQKNKSTTDRFIFLYKIWFGLSTLRIDSLQ